MKPVHTLLVASSFLAACGGGHHGDGTDPSTVPISAVTSDAVYVVNGGDASVTVIDAASRAVLGTIDIADGSYPHHLYLSEDRREMFLAIPGSDLSGGHGGGAHGGAGFVMRLDAATGETLAARALDSANHNAAPSPVDGTVWTTQMAEPGFVLVLDPTTLEIEDEIEVEDMPAEVTFAPDGSTAFAANGGSGTVSAIDASTHEVVATIAVGAGPVGAWPAADGRLYVDNETGKSISAIDPDALEVAQTYDLGFTPAYAATYGDELWVTDLDAGRVVFFDLVTGDETGSVATGANAHAIAFSNDLAWVTNQDEDTVSVIDPTTHAVVETVEVGDAPNGILYREAP